MEDCAHLHLIKSPKGKREVSTIMFSSELIVYHTMIKLFSLLFYINKYTGRKPPLNITEDRLRRQYAVVREGTTQLYVSAARSCT